MKTVRKWRVLCAAHVITIALSACQEPSAPIPAIEDEPEVQPILAPWIDESVLSPTIIIVDSTRSTRGPTLAGDLEERTLDYLKNERTTAFVSTTRAGIISEHDYAANYSSITSTMSVSRGDMEIASRELTVQEYVPFLLHFGRSQHLTLRNNAVVPQRCGYAASGHASHKAWWGFYGGSSNSEWGLVTSPSVGREAKGKCQGNGLREDEIHQGGGVVCTVLITYDLDTLEIVNVDVLSCSSGGGEAI